MEMLWKTYRAEVKAVNQETGEVDMLILVSTDSVDRDGEIVEPTAFKKTLPKFMKRPVLVASHDYRDLTSQIGEWTKLKITEGGLEGKPKYYVGAGNEQADWGFYLASKGMAAFSIGFVPLTWEDGDGVKEPRRTYKEVELLEVSQVIVPSNREAIQSIRSKSVDPIVTEICDEVESGLEPEDEPDWAGARHHPELNDPEIVKEIITKPEETDEFIRIPVRECQVTATIDISKKEGISALYCGKEKQVRTYLFRKDKGWTMTKAKAWVREHEKKTFEPHEVSQSEIIDEIDYLKSLIEKEGLSEEGKKSFEDLMRVSGYDKPVEILPKEGNQIPKLGIPFKEIQESIKRIMEVK